MKAIPDFLKLRDPLNATPLQLNARRLYLLLAVLFTAGLVLMVFVAGVGALVDAQHFAAHRGLSYPLMLLLLVMLVVGLIGRIGLFPLFLTGVTLLILTFQFPFIYAFSGSGRALHVANAMLLFWLSLLLQKQAGELLAETRTARAGPVARAVPGVATFVLSVVFIVVYAVSSPAGATVRALPADASGAQIYAAACASCHGPDGSGGQGPGLVANSNVMDSEYVKVVITEGQGAMPPQDALSAEQVNRVVEFVQAGWQE